MGRVSAVAVALACLWPMQAPAQDSVAKDGIRQTLIPNYLYREHDAIASPDLRAMKDAARPSIFIDGPRYAPIPDEAWVAGWQGEDATLGQLIDVMALSMGFSPVFAWPPDRYLEVDLVPDIALPASDFARVLSASSRRRVNILSESRMVFVAGPEVSR